MTAWVSELERMWRTAAWHSPWVLHWHCLKWLRKTTKNFRIHGLWTQIWAQDLSNKKPECQNMWLWCLAQRKQSSMFYWVHEDRYVDTTETQQWWQWLKQQQQQSWNIKKTCTLPTDYFECFWEKKLLFFLTVWTKWVL